MTFYMRRFALRRRDAGFGHSYLGSHSRQEAKMGKSKMLCIPRLLKWAAFTLCPFAVPLFAETAGAATHMPLTDVEHVRQCGSNDPDIAITGCTALIQSGQETQTAWAGIYQRRGIAYYNKGLTDQAIADYTQVIALKPDFAPAYYDRAEVLLNTGDPDDAIDDYTKAIELRPRYGEAYADRGVALSKKGQIDQAIADETQAVTIQPALAEAYTHRAVFYMTKNLTDQAIADCNKAIAIEPDYAQPYYERGLAKKAKGDMAGGDADIARARQLNPNTGK
jgi:tetratricopeptide (TPR) repeat protein